MGLCLVQSLLPSTCRQVTPVRPNHLLLRVRLPRQTCSVLTAAGSVLHAGMGGAVCSRAAASRFVGSAGCADSSPELHDKSLQVVLLPRAPVEDGRQQGQQTGRLAHLPQRVTLLCGAAAAAHVRSQQPRGGSTQRQEGVLV